MELTKEQIDTLTLIADRARVIGDSTTNPAILDLAGLIEGLANTLVQSK